MFGLSLIPLYKGRGTRGSSKEEDHPQTCSEEHEEAARAQDDRTEEHSEDRPQGRRPPGKKAGRKAPDQKSRQPPKVAFPEVVSEREA